MGQDGVQVPADKQAVINKGIPRGTIKNGDGLLSISSRLYCLLASTNAQWGDIVALTMFACLSNAFTLASNFLLFLKLIKTCVLFLTLCCRTERGP